MQPIFLEYILYLCMQIYTQFICGRRLPIWHRFRRLGDAGQLFNVYENTKVVDGGKTQGARAESDAGA